MACRKHHLTQADVLTFFSARLLDYTDGHAVLRDQLTGQDFSPTWWCLARHTKLYFMLNIEWTRAPTLPPLRLFRHCLCLCFSLFLYALSLSSFWSLFLFLHTHPSLCLFASLCLSVRPPPLPFPRVSGLICRLKPGRFACLDPSVSSRL